MIPVSSFAGQIVALFGLGGSGLSTAKALAAGGALVNAWDDSSAARDKASAEGIRSVRSCATPTGPAFRRWCSRPACR